jgi:hypothetical protein
MNKGKIIVKSFAKNVKIKKNKERQKQREKRKDGKKQIRKRKNCKMDNLKSLFPIKSRRDLMLLITPHCL